MKKQGFDVSPNRGKGKSNGFTNIRNFLMPLFNIHIKPNFAHVRLPHMFCYRTFAVFIYTTSWPAPRLCGNRGVSSGLFVQDSGKKKLSRKISSRQLLLYSFISVVFQLFVKKGMSDFAGLVACNTVISLILDIPPHVWSAVSVSKVSLKYPVGKPVFKRVKATA